MCNDNNNESIKLIAIRSCELKEKHTQPSCVRCCTNSGCSEETIAVPTLGAALSTDEPHLKYGVRQRSQSRLGED